jgi:hypothetical protein
MRVTMVVLAALMIIGVGSTVFVSTSSYYMRMGSQGLYSYEVYFNDGLHIKNLGVIVDVNVVSLPSTLFVGETKNMTLGISAENQSSIVENFSWSAFWVELSTSTSGRWILVAVGDYFLDGWESSSLLLNRQLDIPVRAVNLNYLESAGESLLRIKILMDVHYNNTEYSFDFYTPRDIGPVAVLSPVFSPMILSVFCAGVTAILAVTVSRNRGVVQENKKRKNGIS